MKTEEGVRKFEAIAQEVADLVLEFGGALSGEHGDGLVRSPFMRQMFGPVLYEAFREIKRTFDPQGIFNPGKIVDAPPLTANLRFGAGYQTPESAPRGSTYDEYGGMGGAVEMCSGVGACRKKLAGTMCPSYMATREEAHSTRGRANVLRLAMSGQLGEAGLGDEGVYEVLDLCLECRACKAECPVGVDMARFKSEFLADYWKRHGTPLRARALGKIDRLSRWGSRFAPLANWLNRRRLGAGSTSASWASTGGARFPRGSGETFERWCRRNPVRAASDAQAVTLFNDTFTNHYDPEIGIAALRRCCERGGCAVDRRAAGMLRPAADLAGPAGRRRARTRSSVVEGLLPIAERGEKILFCEPSCLSAVKEDAPSLLRGDLQRKARTVADACMLFDEFAATLDLPLRAGHGTYSAARPLSSESRWECCRPPWRCSRESRSPQWSIWMPAAAAWRDRSAISRSTYDVSQAIAERRLLPAVKAMAARRCAGRARHVVPPSGGRSERDHRRASGGSDTRSSDVSFYGISTRQTFSPDSRTHQCSGPRSARHRSTDDRSSQPRSLRSRA